AMGGVFRFLTAGESHGEALVAVIDGVPAGLPLTEADINGDLARRQRGYGRGGRMKIERDQVHVLSGVRWGATLGSPITLSIANRDWENWKATMGVAVPEAGTAKKEVTRPRPGHARQAGGRLRGRRAGLPGRPRLLRAVGPAARRPARAGLLLDPGDQGLRVRHGLRDGAHPRLGRARRDPVRGGPGLQPLDQQ